MVSSRSRALLLIPPTAGKRFVLRDYYCSTSSKAGYYWQPIDLLAQSGWLAREFDVRVLDATGERLSPNAALTRVRDVAPDYVLALAGSVTLHADMAFLERVVETTGARLAVSGDFPRFESAAVFERYPFVEAALTDFTTPALTLWWTTDTAGATRATGATRAAGVLTPGITTRYGTSPDTLPATFSYPLPAYQQFTLEVYRVPFGRPGHFASILTNYGCPFPCQYCNSGQAGFRTRALDNILEEWDWAHRAGVTQVFVKDMTFGVNRAHAVAVLDAVIERPYRHAWHCYSRVDLLDRELVERMKAAGCFLVQLGIESASAEVVQAMGRPYATEAVYAAVRLLHEAGIKVGTHFVLGLPGDTRASVLDMLRLARDLKPTYASFNIGTPRYGSTLRQRAIAQGHVHNRLDEMDSSGGAETATVSDALTATELAALRRTLTRRFYARPQYLLRRLRAVRHWDELPGLASAGWNVLRA